MGWLPDVRGAPARLLGVHVPTQGMRQGNDAGTQHRSEIYWHSPEQQKAAEASREAYQKVLKGAGYGGIGGTGVSCPVGIAPAGE